MCHDFLQKITVFQSLCSLLAHAKTKVLVVHAQAISSSRGWRRWRPWSVWCLGRYEREKFCELPHAHSLPESMVAFKIRSCSRLQTNLSSYFNNCLVAVGPLAQSVERGADNAKVVSSTLTRTTTMYFFFNFVFVFCCCCFVTWFKNILKLMFVSFFSANASRKTLRAIPGSWTQATKWLN